MKGHLAPAVAIAAVLWLVFPLSPPLRAAADDARLQPGTLAAWTAYERDVDARYQTPDPFFAQDTFARATAWRQTAIGGSTPMLEISAARPGGAAANVPDGSIHHWAGAIFVSGITLDRVLTYLQDHAGQESGTYDDVIASRLLSRAGPRLRVFMKIKRTKVITATYNTEHDVEYRRLSPGRASGRSVATKIAELVDAGSSQERERPPGDDSGYLWRLNAYWRYEQQTGGVLIECESVSLSRSIPFLVRPLISGMVEGVARDSLERTLAGLRRALTAAR